MFHRRALSRGPWRSITKDVSGVKGAFHNSHQGKRDLGVPVSGIKLSSLRSERECLALPFIVVYNGINATCITGS